ncbi:sigma-70 family RNA polymerase sigma factor [Demequina sp.]|uniref:sigma-70 family RNA polymerase sigma factor n=1 Tax=Demequina sp. TaxID=2050685 RepID=UPI0025B8A7D0|nr:sigma-70 family RNA polymerase sigma factor [Demequina sp.]
MNSQRHLRVVGDAAAPAASPTAPAEGALSRSAVIGQLLVRVGRGDESAFDELYTATAASVFGVALRVVRDRAIAEEVAQDVLVEVWRRAARYRPEAGSGRTWILTMAHRRAIDRVRSEQAHTDRLRAHGSTITGSHDEPDTVVDMAHREWEVRRVREGLALLTERQREALDLAFAKGFTHREVAASLGIPLGTAKARIRDGLIKLRDAWEEER